MAKKKEANKKTRISIDDDLRLKIFLEHLKEQGYTAKEILIAVIPRTLMFKADYIKGMKEIIKDHEKTR